MSVIARSAGNAEKKRRQLIIISKSHVWVGTRKEESLETLSENHE